MAATLGLINCPGTIEVGVPTTFPQTPTGGIAVGAEQPTGEGPEVLGTTGNNQPAELFVGKTVLMSSSWKGLWIPREPAYATVSASEPVNCLCTLRLYW